MLKNKGKLIVLLIAIVMLISTFSIATESTMPGDNARTVDDDGIVTTSEEPAPVDADEETVTDEVTTPEIYNGDLYLINSNVVMDKYVDGNVFIIGSNVEITGRVNGSLFVVGSKVTFSEDSYVVQSIYACANELNLNGAANDLYAVGKKITMTYNSFMIRDLRVAANTFDFYGGTGRDAYVTADNFNFSTESGNSAIVYGNLNYTSHNELELSSDLVQGETTFSKMDIKDNESVGEIILDYVVSLLQTIVFTLVIFLLLGWLAPKFVEASKEYASKKVLTSFGIGLLAFIVAIFICFALLFTYVGVSLAFAVLGVFALMMFVSSAITATCITLKAKEKLNLDKKYSTILLLVAVTLIIWVVEQVPYIGGIVSTIVTLVGFGTLL